MAKDLYYVLFSAPCRTVMLTAKLLGIELNLIKLDFWKGDHLDPEFVKLNPRHAVPTLNDDGFILTESRAIASYLVDRYAKDDSLYPKDIKKRALVDQRIYFDACTIYPRFSDYYCSIMWWGKEADPEKLQKFKESIQFLDKFLEGETWVAGDHLTIADIDLVTTVTSAEILGFDVRPYPNVSRWLTSAKKTLPGYEEINHAGCLEYRKIWDDAENKKKAESQK